MKTTIEIADDLFVKAREVARKEKTTLRALTEEGLRVVLAKRQTRARKKLPPLITFGGRGLTAEFAAGGWEAIRDEIYRIRSL